MSLSHMEERRPRGKGTAFQKPADPATTNAPKSAPTLPDAADLVAGVFVLVVTVLGDPDPRHRRRVFLQAQPAQRAADRAVERGHHAEVVLCRLVPEGIAGWSA